MVAMTIGFPEDGRDKTIRSVVKLAQELIRRSSRGGIDDYGPVLAVLEDWLTARAVPHRRLHDGAGKLVGLLAEVPGDRPGPWWTLDACVDTAPYGDPTRWSFDPTSGQEREGWLLGRGAADSKLAVAMYCHIAADLAAGARNFAGGLCVLLDVDEHTGNFGGARAYLADPHTARPAGVIIGYPGMNEVVVGGRGLWRATIAVHAMSGHSGSNRTVTSAVSRAARLVGMLDATELPSPDAASGFPLGPKLTVTAFHGGEGFSVTPHRVDINVDVRTTPSFDARDAEALVRSAVSELDADLPAPLPTEVVEVASWPAFRLEEDEQPAAALLFAARAAGLDIRAKTAGPSNIGNLLARHGIPATAGFGVPYEGLHGIDERASLTELPDVYAIHQRAVAALLDVS
ncbi:M20 family metallopeptidase [Streptomyces sp. NPDC056549]|uniref:M20 family metallopeptidase n=1 Tax=Streptomyces sp. NPDC056549 TaxID=3345864 RepID=UPI003676F564